MTIRCSGSRFRNIAFVTGAALCVAGSAHAMQRESAARPAVSDTGTLAQVPGDSAAVAGMLPNGVRFLVRAQRDTAPGTMVRLVVNAGSEVEDADQRGLSHFLEHVLLGAMGQLQEQRGEGLASMHGVTTEEKVFYEVTVDPTDEPLENTLASFSDFETVDVANPVMPFDVVRPWVLQEWSDRLIPLQQSDSLRHLSGGNRIGIGIRRIIDSVGLTSAGVEALARLLKDWYRPDQLGVVVVGDVDRNRVVGMIRSHFGALAVRSHPRRRPPRGGAPWTGPRVAVIARDSASANVFFRRSTESAPADSTPPPIDYARQALLESVLRERLGATPQNDQPWSRGPSVDCVDRMHARQAHPGCELNFPISDTAPTADVTALLATVQQLRDVGPTAAELDRARANVRAELARLTSIEDTSGSAGRAATYVHCVLYRCASVGYEAAAARPLLDQLKPDDLRQFARDCCGPDRLALAVYLPPSKLVAQDAVETVVRSTLKVVK